MLSSRSRIHSHGLCLLWAKTNVKGEAERQEESLGAAGGSSDFPQVIYWPVKPHDLGRMINTLETSSNFRVSYFDAGTNLQANQPPLCALSSMPYTSPEGETEAKAGRGRAAVIQGPNVPQVGGRDKRQS